MNKKKQDECKIDEAMYIWKCIYSYVIPSLCVVLYIIYLLCIYHFKKEFRLPQESENFAEMLKTLVTFMSIILSVFGFLIPSFLSGKSDSSMIKYFLKNVDQKVFAVKLKNVVSSGLIDIFVTCLLLLNDIFATWVVNFLIAIWLWLLFYFLCSSYRFIGLIINLILIEKNKITQELGNELSKAQIDEMNKKIRKL